MGHNGAPKINVSTFPREHVGVSNERVAQLVCPGCGQWKRVKRHMIEPHTCTYGGQRIWIDVDTEAIERDYRKYASLVNPNALRAPDASTQVSKPPPGVALPA